MADDVAAEEPLPVQAAEEPAAADAAPIAPPATNTGGDDAATPALPALQNWLGELGAADAVETVKENGFETGAINRDPNPRPLAGPNAARAKRASPGALTLEFLCITRARSRGPGRG